MTETRRRPTGETVIQTEGLTKYYGKRRGVLELTLSVQPGEAFGYLGPNGAGKTTTIRTLLDFIRPTGGVAKVFGLDSHRDAVEIHRRVGYLPGEMRLYENLTGEELLRYLASLRGSVDWPFVRTLAARLDCELHQHIRSLSHGNKQKLGLVQAFMHRPSLLVLDEPTQGLDPLVQREFYRLVVEAKSDGHTVFLSSHVMPEVEHTCDRVGIIREGRLVTVEHVADLKANALRRLEIHFGGPVPSDAFARLEGARDVHVENSILRCTVSGSLDAVIKAAARFEVVNLISEEPTLEEIFLAYYAKGGADAP